MEIRKHLPHWAFSFAGFAAKSLAGGFIAAAISTGVAVVAGLVAAVIAGLSLAESAILFVGVALIFFAVTAMAVNALVPTEWLTPPQPPARQEPTAMHPTLPSVSWDAYAAENIDPPPDEGEYQRWKWETDRADERAVREALHEAHTTLDFHEGVLRNYSTARTSFDPKYQGLWPKHQALLAGDRRYDAVVHYTNRAFNSIALIDPGITASTSLHQQAIHNIEAAKAILEAALEAEEL
jgi:hypothetical protein